MFSDGFFGSGYAWDKNGDKLECSDNNPRPSQNSLKSCNKVTKNTYKCTRTNYYGMNTGGKNKRSLPSMTQWIP